jgi:hypothetical protein
MEGRSSSIKLRRSLEQLPFEDHRVRDLSYDAYLLGELIFLERGPEVSFDQRTEPPGNLVTSESPRRKLLRRSGERHLQTITPAKEGISPKAIGVAADFKSKFRPNLKVILQDDEV